MEKLVKGSKNCDKCANTKEVSDSFGGGYSNNHKLRELQKVEIDILDEFVRLCELYNLTYYICYGTLLGAVRHKGFIPWDDDIDVTMPRRDFEKFCRISKKSVASGYIIDCYLTDKNYLDGSAKLRKVDTVYSDDWHLRIDYISHGCWIDIFPLDNLSGLSGFSYFLQSFVNKKIIDKMALIRQVKELSGLKTKTKVIHRLVRMLPVSFIFSIREKLCQLNNKNENSKYVANMLLPYPFEKGIFPREDFEPLCKVEFEGKFYNAPKNYQNVLRHIYGDYMKLPPERDRVLKHQAYKWEI